MGLHLTGSSLTQLNNAFAGALTATAVKTSAYSAAAGDLIPVDATSGAVTVTLPIAPTDRTRVGIKKIDTSTNAVTVSRGGSSDVFNKAGGSTSLTLALANQALSLQYSGGIWYVVGDDLPLSGLDARYARVGAVPSRPALTPTNGNPGYWGHRGGSYFQPEQTIESYGTLFAANVPVLDGDVRLLGDGVPVLIHDETVDRTTDGTGNVVDFTVPSFLTLNAAAKFPYPKAESAALVGDVIAKYAQSAYLSLEPRSPGVELTNTTADLVCLSTILDLSDRAGAGNGVIVNTLDPAIMAAAKTRGYKVYFYWGNHATGPNNDGVGGTTITIAQAVAAGADFLGCDGLLTTDASITALVASGVPVLPYGVNRRIRRDQLLALGVAGFLTDQPLYLPRNTAFTTVASWKYGVVGHGLNQYPINPTPTSLAVTGGALVLSGLASGQYITVGEMCPLANTAGTYNVDLDLAYLGTPTTGSAILLFFGVPDDNNYDLASGTSANKHPASGWVAYQRASGVFSLIKLNNTGSAYASVGNNLNTPALVANGIAHLNVRVTSTTITVFRTDAAAAITTSGTLTSGAAITSIPVTALANSLSSGSKLLLPTGQIASVSSTAAAAATSISVSSITPSSTVASGSLLNPGMAVTDSTGRGGYIGVGRTTVDPSIGTSYKNLAVS